MSARLHHWRSSALMLAAFVAAACSLAAVSAGASALTPPCRLAAPSLDVVTPLVVGDVEPQLLLAQRAIERDLRRAPAEETPFALVEIPGWKSEGGAAALSLALPGTGQLYSGSKRGYLFLGVEAVALLSYASFQSKSEEKRDEYYAYVGDPNSTSSRFSFDRLAGDVSPEELARLRTVYERDKAEFYQAVTRQEQYAGGWQVATDRTDAQSIAADSDKQRSRSRFGLYTLFANHLVSAFDALNLARFNNIALRDNMTLKLKLRPGFRHGSYAFALTQKF